MNYEDLTFDMLGTKRQRPMLCSEVWNYKKTLSMKDYPLNTHEYVKYFLEENNS